MKTTIARIIRFVQKDVWRIRASTLPKNKSFFLNQLRTILLALRGFDEDRCQLRASALTFYSLLSIVPIAAMAFGVAKGFGFQQLLEKQLYAKFPGQQDIVAKIIEFANSFLANTQGGVIAGIGVAILFWVVIKVLGNIESSFNDIWGIKKGRSLDRKFSDYLSLMLICPILFIMSSSLTVLIMARVTRIVQAIPLLEMIGPAVMAVLHFLPYGVIWILFTFIYIFMPNTKVKLSAGLPAGIIAGTIYQFVQWVYITFQVGASKYGAIYGSFAALPLFLVWLQMSWLIVLFGAEISFAQQNVETYEFEQDSLKISYSFKRLLALRITQLCVKNFNEAQPPWTAAMLSHHCEIPVRIVNQILYELTAAGILIEVRPDDAQNSAYQPAHDIESLTIATVMTALDSRGIDDIPVEQTKEVKTLEASLQAFGQMVEKSPANLVLKGL